MAENKEVKVINIPITEEHARIALKALRFYAIFGQEEYDFPGGGVLNSEIEYLEAIIKFYEAAEVLKNEQD